MSIIPFDDRDGLIFYNGKFINWRDAKCHILNHGLHYGSSVFEGVGIYSGKIFKNTEHNERFKESARILGFEISYSVQELDDLCIEACKKNNITDGYIRPVAWRGSEKMAISAPQNSIHVAIATWSWPPYYSTEGKINGINMIVAKWRRPDPRTAPVHAKAAGLYMICTDSKHEADAKGYQDALMLDFDDCVAEGCSANFFLIKGDELHTPIADRFLNGITRQTVIELAKKRGYKVFERRIKLEELEDFNDAFVTGTAAEVTRINKIATRDEKTEYKFEKSEVSLNLIEDYQDLIHGR